MKALRALAFATFTLTASAGFAESRTVTLSIPGMNCDLCPITIKKAVSKVPGVSSVDASYERKQAVVTFDDTKTTLEAITKATANAGYPSSVKKP